MSAPTVDLAQYTNLVHQQAWRWARRLPRRSILTEPDLAQEGWVSLTKALRWYKPGRGAFSTYATIALARRFAEIIRQEHRRAQFAGLSLDEMGVQGHGLGHGAQVGQLFSRSVDARGRLAPSQTLVETRVDFARGHWDGPALRTARQAEEARERLAVLA